MSQIFFYHGASDKLAAACALISGAYAKRKPMLIFAPEKSLAEQVDRNLWTQSQLSFIPHCRLDSPLASETPILITETLAGVDTHERLMSLSAEPVPDLARFANIVEVVSQDEADRQAARTRVQFYKAQGYPIQYFDLSQR